MHFINKYENVLFTGVERENIELKLWFPDKLLSLHGNVINLRGYKHFRQYRSLCVIACSSLIDFPYGQRFLHIQTSEQSDIFMCNFKHSHYSLVH